MARPGSKELEISLREHRPVSLIYLDSKGVITQRVVQVTELAKEEVRAYCLTRKGPRTFRRDQVLAVSLQIPRGRGSAFGGWRKARTP
jgi:predicted DNA-binding transcriptional regulator YafY